ncbi:MAG TPA: PilZ domain-containing protein [Bacilli bacterium]
MINNGRVEFGANYLRSEAQLSLLALMHSRTVLESIDYVSTGTISYAEGDILEVEIFDTERFSLGETLKVTVYSPIGIFTFYSTIIARAEDALMIFHPPEHQKKFGEKRDYPRIPVTKEASIISLSAPSETDVISPDLPLAVSLRNMSMGGIGFVVEETLHIPERARLTLELEFDEPFACTMEVVRNKPETDGFNYIGAKFVDLQDPLFSFLRSYILHAQVELYYQNKIANKHDQSKEKRHYRSLV